MIDLHCHIIPGVDDGAQTLEDSIAMAKSAASQGIHTIVATPHHQNGRFMNEKSTILQKIESLNEALKQEDIALTILPGQENRLFGNIVEDYQNGKIVTVNETNKYILIEFPSDHVPRYAEQLFYELQTQGLIPILVHPERNAELIQRPDILYKLVTKGALTQVTASSLTGHFGKNVKKFSLQLVEHNLTHVIASDAHNVTNRAFHLREGSEVLEKEFGTDLAIQFQENAYIIISGKSVYKEDPEPIRRKKLFGIF
ncbi:tyrosine-protein phosphatase [Microbacteriaceae bacterium 4G12]